LTCHLTVAEIPGALILLFFGAGLVRFFFGAFLKDGTTQLVDVAGARNPLLNQFAFFAGLRMGMGLQKNRYQQCFVVHCQD
jgi:hypothetical protein